MEQAHILISGKVQGVGFRQFIRKLARKRGLTGWVQNLPDGRVEAIIQGDKHLIEEMLIAAKRGTFLSQVHTVETTWEESMAFIPTFTIKQPQQ